MGTQKQKKLAREIVENSKRAIPKNAGELLESSGYAKKSATSVPGKIIKQKGVKEELAILGFNEETAKKVVESIMLDKRVRPEARLKATDQVFKVEGSYAPEVHKNLNVDIPLDIKEIERLDKVLGLSVKVSLEENDNNREASGSIQGN